MILCVGLAADETFTHTTQALARRGLELHVVDLAQTALAGDVDVQLDDLSRSSIALRGTRVMLGDCQAAYVRLIDVSRGAPSENVGRRAGGIYHALMRLFEHAPLKVLNRPLRDASNFSKVFHASLFAAVSGWRVPRTLLTQDVGAARAFIAECPDGVIFKGASGVKTWVREFVPERDQERLPLLATCPVLFQERIAGPDVRVHVVSDFAFGERIDSPEVDYRRIRKNQYSQLALPSEIAAGCTRLTRFSDVPFLGVDFKIQEATGQWFFLEANAMPCYQGYDRRAGGAISQKIGDWLVNA